MSEPQPSDNVFARELALILDERGLQWSQLEEMVGLDSTTVERLEQALRLSQSTVLSLDDMELLDKALLLNASEQGRLKGALLVMELKRTLHDQLHPAYVRQIIEQIFPLLVEAAIKTDLDTLQKSVRGDHDAREDTTWSAIWQMLDAADLAMQLSRGLSEEEQKRRLREARMYLEGALERLEKLPGGARSLRIWQTCQQKASKNLKTANRRLQSFEKK